MSRLQLAGSVSGTNSGNKPQPVPAAHTRVNSCLWLRLPPLLILESEEQQLHLQLSPLVAIIYSLICVHVT